MVLVCGLLLIGSCAFRLSLRFLSVCLVCFCRPQIDDAAIARFVADLDPVKVICAPAVGYPLAFADLYDEVNFMALTQLLNIGYARAVGQRRGSMSVVRVSLTCCESVRNVWGVVRCGLV